MFLQQRLKKVRKRLPVESLHNAIATRFSIGIARRNWVSLFFNAGWTTLTMSRSVSWLIRKSLLQYCSKFWSFSVLSNQSSSLWYAHNERLLRMFISKSVERITEAKTCFLCRYVLMLLTLRNNARVFLFLYLNFSIRFMTHNQQLTSHVNHREAYFFFHVTKYDHWNNDRQIS